MNTRGTPTRQATATPAPGFIRLQAAINKFLGNDFPPGPHFIPWYVPINLQKGGTLVVCLGLMRYYENYSVAAQCYTVAHGSYGLVWLLKHFLFPDPTWDARVTLLSAVNAFLLVLGTVMLGFGFAFFMLVGARENFCPNSTMSTTRVIVHRRPIGLAAR